MSEYQYYEFRALDRRLTPEEMAELRKLSTRATITPTGLVNVYHYGDFRGDPLALMNTYFDAFLYVANWGTHELMLRLPGSLLAPDVTAPYTTEGCLEFHRSGGNVIMVFRSEDEEAATWEEGEGRLDRLIPLREELAADDLRALYLGWLACAAMGALDDEEIEPPVPAGLRTLSPALQALMTFLWIDEDMVAVAAERSPTMRQVNPTTADLQQWIHDLPEDEKDILLLRVIQEPGMHLRTELSRRFRAATAPVGLLTGVPGSRTVGTLLAEVEERAEARRKAAAERATAKQEAYLADLATREDEIWGRIETLVEMKRPAEYDQAIQYLGGLRTVARRAETLPTFESRLKQLRRRHAGKRSFLDRLNSKGLTGG